MSRVFRSRILHVARGAQRGVNVPLTPGFTCLIGSAPSPHGVQLRDEGVVPRHCALEVDGRGHLVVTALDASVWVGQRELPPGASMAMPDFLPLRCGAATLLVGPEGSDWSYSIAAAQRAPGWRHRTGDGLQRLQATSQIAAGAVLMVSALLVAGSVWGTVNWLTAPPSSAIDNFAQVQRWLPSVAPSDSELQLIGDDTLQRLVVSGYVATERQRTALTAALARQPDAPHAEVVSVEQMLAGVAQAAAQQGLRCEAAYRGAGRAACSNEMTDIAAAERLRRASAQVMGLRELSLQVAAPPAAAAKAQSSRRYAVLMSNKRGNQLVGPGGERWHEGDAFDGMTIRRIAFDQVVFARGGGGDEVVRWLAELN
jgi:hypothetical protein